MLPVIFIHRGNRWHLPYILAQAKYANPDSPIILLGNEQNRKYKFIEHYPIDDYLAGALSFQKIYRHLSYTKIEFELFCFQRWFILLDFMARQGIESCVTLDSDVMLYSNVTEEQRNWAGYELTMCGGGAVHVSFINSIAGLANLCAVMTNMYTDQKLLQKMMAKFDRHDPIHNPGGVCDMSAVFHYNRINPGRMGDLQLIRNESAYDMNMNVSHGYEMENGLKKIYWSRDKHPLGRLIEGNKFIRFHALHFQGQAKEKISAYFTGTFGRRLKIGMYANFLKVSDWAKRFCHKIHRRLFFQHSL